MSLHKLNYHFTLIKARKNRNNLCPINLRITLDSKRVTISTNKAIQENQWINKDGLLTTDKAVNQYLAGIERKLINIFNELSNADKEITAQILKNALLGVEERKHTLISAIEFHNKNMESLIGIKYSEGTYKNYRVTLRYIKEFIPLAYQTKDLPLNKLNYDFLKKYELFLTGVKNCTNNGVMKQIQRLKKVINLAISNEWLDKNPFVKFKIKYNKKDRGFLTKSELDILEKVELPARLAKVRDYFMFSCYTGLAYSDIASFNNDNIELDDEGNEWIVINRKKTKIQALIPILPKAKAHILKYRDRLKSNMTIFPVASNQKTNDYLKEIASFCGIKKNISYHLARHTFATTITLTNGVPIETVSKMLGHTKIATTQIYSRVLKSKILKDMKGLGD